MKKITLLFCLLAFLPLTSLAQGSEKSVVDVRPYFGFNFTQISDNKQTRLIDSVFHNQTVSGQIGFQYGVAMSFGNRFYVQPAFQYTILTTEVVNESNSSNVNYEDVTRINMFTVPLKVGFRFIDPHVENFFDVRVFGGLNGSFVSSVTNRETSGKIDAYEKDDFNKFILSADVGAGVDLFIFFVDLGYQFGLNNFYSDDYKSTHNVDGNPKAGGFYANAGLRFTFNK